MSINDDLKELAEHHEAGSLSHEEFEAAKERLLQGDQVTEEVYMPPPKRGGCNTALKVILVIVIGIPVGLLGIGFIGALMVQNVPAVLERAHSGAAKANITTISQGVDTFIIMNNGRHPESLELLVTPDENGETFLKSYRVPTDSWGREFLYAPPLSGSRGYRIYTLGKDGVPGGEGADMDIDNWMIQDGEI